MLDSSQYSVVNFTNTKNEHPALCFNFIMYFFRSIMFIVRYAMKVVGGFKGSGHVYKLNMVKEMRNRESGT